MKNNTVLLELLKHMHPCPCPVYYVYDIPTDPDKTIQFVEFDYDCRFRLKAFAWLRVDCESTDNRYLTECPCAWKLNRKVRNLKLVANTLLVPDYLHTSVVYEQPEVWVRLAPGDSYPLPEFPPEILRITVEAKTEPGPNPQISALAYGTIFDSKVVYPTPQTFELILSGGPYPAEHVDFENTGDTTVYIRNLTTFAT